MFSKKDAGPICPLVRGECLKTGCTFWCTVQGKDPQTGRDLSSSNCVLVMLPMIMLENNKEVRQAAAATESARNEFVNTGRSIGEHILIAAAANRAMQLASLTKPE